jgi:hypothetical protein
LAAENIEGEAVRSEKKQGRTQTHLAEDRPRLAVLRVTVSDSLRLRTSLVNGGVDEVAGLIDRELSAVTVRTTIGGDEDEVGDSDLRVVHREGIHPELREEGRVS